MDESTLLDLLPAYALGALSDEDRAQVEAYIAASPEAQAELQTYQDMLAGMATLVPARQAPAHLNDDFRQRLANLESGTAAPRSAPLLSVIPKQQRRSSRLIMAIAALVVVAIGIVGLLAATNESRTIQGILANPAAVRINLNPQQNAAGSVALVTVPNQPTAVVVAQLPNLPTDKQYQLWLISDQQIKGTGVFSADQPSKQILITLADQPDKYKAVGLTVEPAGGSPQPSSAPIFLANITQ
ncbi:MAG: anti-sigma factor [Anaerolineae bacterium]|nr:anti-sigma factor [Anaerolineae bacterium]